MSVKADVGPGSPIETAVIDLDDTLELSTHAYGAERGVRTGRLDYEAARVGARPQDREGAELASGPGRARAARSAREMRYRPWTACSCPTTGTVASSNGSFRASLGLRQRRDERLPNCGVAVQRDQFLLPPVGKPASRHVESLAA